MCLPPVTGVHAECAAARRHEIGIGGEQMQIALSFGDMAMLAAALACAGVVTGFLAGLLGIGGGGIVVPVLYEAFALIGVDPAIRMHLTIGTSLAVMVPTAARSFYIHKERGTVDMALVKRLTPWTIAGVGIGTLIASAVQGTILKVIWVTAAVFMLTRLLLGRDDWRLGDEIPRHPGPGIYAACIGALGTVMSIGGGAFFAMLMTLYGRSLHQAVATSAAFGPVIAFPGMLGFMWAGWGRAGLPPGSIGFVSLLGAALIVPTSVLAAPWGARLTHRLHKRTLELLLATFFAVATARFLYSLLG